MIDRRASVLLGVLIAGCPRTRAPGSVASTPAVEGCWRVDRTPAGDLSVGSVVCFLEDRYTVVTSSNRLDVRSMHWTDRTSETWIGAPPGHEGDSRQTLHVRSQHDGANIDSAGASVHLARPAGFDADAALARARAAPSVGEVCLRARRCAEAADALVHEASFEQDLAGVDSTLQCTNERTGIRDWLGRLGLGVPDACR
jgi:hypothetical protein